MPNVEKTFHRGSTDYFIQDRKIDIGAFDSPKFVGLPVGEILKVGKHDFTAETGEPLSNGDGLNVLPKREVVGFRANTVELLNEVEQDGQPRYQYRIVPNEMPAELKQLRLPQVLNRNLDHNWQQALLKTSAERRVPVRFQVELSEAQLTLNVTSEEGISASANLAGPFGPAKNPQQAHEQLRDTLSKLGTTIYHAEHVEIDAPEALFIPNSQLKTLRRDAIDALTAARLLSALRRAADRRRLRGPRGSGRSAGDDHQALPALLLQPVPETGQGRYRRAHQGRAHAADPSGRSADPEVRLQTLRDAHHRQDEGPHPPPAAAGQRRQCGRFHQPRGPGEDHQTQTRPAVSQP